MPGPLVDFGTGPHLILLRLVRLAEQLCEPVWPLNVPLGSTCVDGMRLILVEREGKLLQSNGARLRHMLVAGELLLLLTSRRVFRSSRPRLTRASTRGFFAVG